MPDVHACNPTSAEPAAANCANMSFELKPMGSTNQQTPNIGAVMIRGSGALAAAIPKIDEIVWTCSRSPVPVMLAGRVPDDVWASTFDAVYARTAEATEVSRKMVEGFTGGLPFIPCCVPCIVCKTLCAMNGHMKEAMNQQQAWLKLVQDEQQKYAPYGVQVTIAQELRVSHSGHDGTTSSMETVGLKFDVAAAAPVVTATVVSPPVQAEIKRDHEA